MKTKQIVGIVITGVVIIAVGITGVASNVIGSKLIKQNKTETSSIVKDMFSSVSGDSNIELLHLTVLHQTAHTIMTFI